MEASQEGVTFGDRTYPGMTNVRALFWHWIALLWAKTSPWQRYLIAWCPYIETRSRSHFMSIHSFIYFPRVVYLTFTPWTVIFYSIFCCIINSIVPENQRLYAVTHSWVLSSLFMKFVFYTTVIKSVIKSVLIDTFVWNELYLYKNIEMIKIV